MKIVWTRRATRRLYAAYHYWARESSPSAADESLEHFFPRSRRWNAIPKPDGVVEFPELVSW